MKIRRAKKLFRHADILTGLSGSPLPQDMLCKRSKHVLRRRLTWREKRWMKRRGILADMKAFKRKCWRESCMNVLGEDPDDWGLSYSEFCEKYHVVTE